MSRRAITLEAVGRCALILLLFFGLVLALDGTIDGDSFIGAGVLLLGTALGTTFRLRHPA